MPLRILGYDLDVLKWTLAEVADRGTLVFECRRCGHRAVIYDDTLARFHPDDRVALLAKLMRCDRCKRRDAQPLVRLNFGRGDAAWWPQPPRLTR